MSQIVIGGTLRRGENVSFSWFSFSCGINIMVGETLSLFHGRHSFFSIFFFHLRCNRRGKSRRIICCDHFTFCHDMSNIFVPCLALENRTTSWYIRTFQFLSWWRISSLEFGVWLFRKQVQFENRWLYNNIILSGGWDTYYIRSRVMQWLKEQQVSKCREIDPLLIIYWWMLSFINHNSVRREHKRVAFVHDTFSFQLWNICSCAKGGTRLWSPQL